MSNYGYSIVLGITTTALLYVTS
jgi:hypothetical protein